MKQITLNTEELIDACRKGNQAAQLEIYKRYYKAMYNTSLRIVKNTAEAEDIMQEAFLIAFTKLESLKDNKTFGAWLKRIVINSSLTAIRKNNSHQEIAIDTIAYSLTNNEDIINNDIKDKQVSKILKMIYELKDNYSTVLSLSLIEGYDYEEISDIMNISYSNCRTMISRAKESLRKKLQLV